MANANQPSERTSHPGGIPSTQGVTSTPNEDRIVAGPDGPERIEGGVNVNATDAFGPYVDGGRRATGENDEGSTGPDGRPNRQNDGGEMADQAG